MSQEGFSFTIRKESGGTGIETKLKLNWKPNILKFNKSNKRREKSIFDNLKVIEADGKQVLLSEKWKDQTIILKVMPRLGCCICRYEAKNLFRLESILEKKNVKIVGVAFEDIDLKDFVSSGYWKWDILVDPDRKVYKAAGLKKLSMTQFLAEAVTKRVKRIDDYIMNDKKISDTFKGDAKQLGGTFVISPDSDKLLYEFRPGKLAMFPSLVDIVNAIQGNPNDIITEDYDKYAISNYIYDEYACDDIDKCKSKNFI